MEISIINGPNLNLLGKREPHIYGTSSFEEFLESLRREFPEHVLRYHQSNSEGKLIDMLHEDGFAVDGIIINPGAYAHTSVALADAIASVVTPVIEVHISNIHAREAYRRQLISGAKAEAVISGAGLSGYSLALQYLLRRAEK